MRMRLGDNFTELLLNSSIEKLICDYDINGSLKIIEDTIGCSREETIEILSGKMVLSVADNKIDIDGEDYNPAIHDKKPYDFQSWCESKFFDITDFFKEYSSMLNKINNLQNKKLPYSITFDVSIKEILKSFANGTKMMVDLNDYLADEYDEINSIKCIGYIQKFVDEQLKILHVVHWLMNNIPTVDNMEYKHKIAVDKIIDLKTRCGFILNGEYLENPFDALIETHVKSKQIISEKVEAGIEPVEISEGWSAGWLSPTGEYYALNGGVSNRLHNCIADALLRQGIIPSSESNNPDKWLDNNGWVKIHDDKVLYAGWMLSYQNLTNIPITQIQKTKICKYGKECWNGVLLFGSNEHEVKISKFRNTELLMLKQYFD